MKLLMHLILIVSLTSLTLGAIAVISIAPPSRADANCSSCHGSSYYLRVEITDFTAPPNITKGVAEQASFTVKVSGSGTNSYYAFKMTARIVSVNKFVSASAAQSNTNQNPSGTSAPYTWTKTYTFTLNGLSAGTDTIRAEAVMDPNHQSPAATQTSTKTIDVFATNAPPALSSGSVSPLSGDTKTPFTYKVLYTDPDGDVPSYIRAMIDGTDMRPLTVSDGTVNTIKTGEEYSLKDVLIGVGNHTCYFEASDGSSKVSFPVSGSLSGPDVIRANTGPLLYDSSVFPDAGMPGTLFSYHVTYKDRENDPPVGGVLLGIDGGTPIVMPLDMTTSLNLRDGDFTNGERYRYVSELPEGIHDFSFDASDPWLGVHLGPFDGPQVSLKPVLRSSILSPLDLSEFYNGTAIDFNSTASSNKAVSDLKFLWYSNISGILSENENFTSVMPLGDHLITLNVSSQYLGLSTDDSVSVRIIEIPAILPEFVVNGSEPKDNVTINETEGQSFSVNYSVRRLSSVLDWYLDGVKVKEDPAYRFVTDHYSAGRHVIRAALLLNGSEVWTRTWTVDVIDVPATVFLTNKDWTVGGPFWVGDEISIIIPVVDELGRNLTAKWFIDGIPLSLMGIQYGMSAGDRPFGSPGFHSGNAVFTNPDGTSLRVDFSYEVRHHDPGNGTLGLPVDPVKPSRGLGPFKDNALGYIILVVGAVGIAAGAFKMTAAIVPEGAFSRLLPKREEIFWEE